MKLAELVARAGRVRGTRSRKEKVHHLAECLRAAETQELQAVAHYLSGTLPQGKLGVGFRQLAETRRVEPASEPSLSIGDVDQRLTTLKEARGAGSKRVRQQCLVELLSRGTAPEQEYLIRLLSGEIRQGALESLVVEAIAAAAEVDGNRVRRAHMLSADLGVLAEAALAQGTAGLERFALKVFTPVQPMLAQTAEGPEEVFQNGEEMRLETKLDGARVQVHKCGPEVRVYSRRLRDVTHAVPEIVEAIQQLPVDSLILDGETIALRSDGTPHPFQTTMRRFGRKLEVDSLRASLPLSTYYFDCLLVDGAPLIDHGLARRTAALAAVIPPSGLIPQSSACTVEDVNGFLQKALAKGHEGIMAKHPAAPYEAGNRGAAWLKLKKVHTVDLVVLAAEWGSGRRKGWLSNLHLGARNPETGGFTMLGKTFKGLSDKLLGWQTQALLLRKLHEEHHVVHVRPELVVEIAFNDVQHSPQYPGGIALRFARVKRYRADKGPEDATTLDEVRAFLPTQ